MKKNIIVICVCGLALLLAALPAFGQMDRNQGIIKSALIGLEYEVKAGILIGGTSPLPLPAEIREISSYNPTLVVAVEGNVTKWLDKEEKWGMMVGLRLENKGMKTDARVKNYGMEIIGDGGEIVKGNWTGNVKTKVKNSYLTVPVLGTYKFSPRFRMNLGPYFSYMMEGDFSGDVYDGYLREGNPTGNKWIFEDGKSASYDFSKNLRKFQWGAQLGAEWRAFKHLNVCADLTWGLNDIFKKDFETITFAMYPIYLNVGFGYAF
ncbi:porin family protein [Parabacteroides sp. AM08-6]|uniref:porin family protein n=1 Tax=Parabacteroides sp. AM08-6 TaxID=2292053 RepID=UPI000EFF1F3B|nr:porin family protein [Parabacteroides sp. AM08-6]RHJ80663.1 PorT family protein [Parabacteroides sp. AM08-6]